MNVPATPNVKNLLHPVPKKFKLFKPFKLFKFFDMHRLMESHATSFPLSRRRQDWG
jgi:hypothetical protein